MKRIATILTLGITLAGCASSGQVEPERGLLAYSCGDTVVLGRLAKTVAVPTEYAEWDILGHGWFFVDLQVQRRLAGPPIEDRTRVKYFGHAALREDRNFIFVVSAIDGGDGYFIRQSTLASSRPRLQNQCGNVR